MGNRHPYRRGVRRTVPAADRPKPSKAAAAKGQPLDVDLGSVFPAVGHVAPLPAAKRRRVQVLAADYALADSDQRECLKEVLATLGLFERVDVDGSES